jgi:hypothetical protein
MRDAATRPQSECEVPAEAEKCDGTVFEFLTDDAFGGKPRPSRFNVTARSRSSTPRVIMLILGFTTRISLLESVHAFVVRTPPPGRRHAGPRLDLSEEFATATERMREHGKPAIPPANCTHKSKPLASSRVRVAALVRLLCWRLAGRRDILAAGLRI